ncbi:SIMPL domain-containing protein [Gordonia sp. NPDC003950]
MSTLEIVVRGNAREVYEPELARVRLVVNVSGEQRDAVYRQAVEVHARVTAAVAHLAEQSAVREWTSQSVWVSSHRPYGRDGKLQDPVYSTDIGIDATFVDFDELGRFVDRWATEPGVDVGGVRWALGEDSRRGHQVELRRLAVDDAVAKAQAYADAVGRGPVVATQLADPDMLSGPTPTARGMVLAGAPMDSGAELDLRPGDIEMTVAVDARFVAE